MSVPSSLILLDNGDFILWDKRFREACGGFGQAGKAIINGLRNDPKFPDVTDMVLDINGQPTTIMKFDHTPATTTVPMEFLNDGKKDFKRAVEKYPRDVDAFEKGGNSSITDYFNLYLGPDVKKSLSTNRSWVTACNRAVTDNFTKYCILLKLYSHGTGKSKNRKLMEFMTCQQPIDMSYAQFVENINNGELTNLANFESKIYPGYIKFSDLKSAVFLNPTKFQFFLDKFYVDHPTGTVPDLDELMNTAAIYAREQMSDIKPDQYSVSLVASTQSSLKCSSCSVPIPHVLNRFGRPHTKCSPCFRAWFSQRKADKTVSPKPGPIVPKLSASDKTLARANVSSTTSLPDSISAMTILLDSDDEQSDD
jgi:hypothetical protein